MEVSFATKKLASTLSEDKRRVREYGDVVARSLQRRLLQLASAPTLESLRTLPGGCHELHGDRAGQLGLSVTANLRLVIRPTDDPPPAREAGGLDWGAVRAITIVEVIDYHD